MRLSFHVQRITMLNQQARTQSATAKKTATRFCSFSAL